MPAIEFGVYAEFIDVILGYAENGLALGYEFAVGVFNGQQQFADVLIIIDAGLFHFGKTGHESDVRQRTFFHKHQFTPGPGTLFTRITDAEDGIQNGVDPQLGVPAQHDVQPRLRGGRG